MEKGRKYECYKGGNLYVWRIAKGETEREGGGEGLGGRKENGGNENIEQEEGREGKTEEQRGPRGGEGEGSKGRDGRDGETVRREGEEVSSDLGILLKNSPVFLRRFKFPFTSSIMQ